ncbi:Non-homologous end joining protein Ku [subsurface metagenome]
MAPKSIWKGAMGFGMVSVPVKLYSATEEKAVHFNQLHRDCQTRIQMPRWCPNCDRKVEQSEIVKGYPVGDNQYVLMEEADFTSLPVKSLKSIDVVAFVESGQIDPRHYNKPYFLAPEDAGTKAFSLFLQAMAKVNLVGICKLGYREREHLATIRAFGGVILLQTLYYADELRNPDEVAPKLADVSDREMEMAITLLQTLQTPNAYLGKYEDEYRVALLDRIQAKLNGQPITVAETAKEEPQMDLVDALMASINAENKAKAAEVK